MSRPYAIYTQKGGVAGTDTNAPNIDGAIIGANATFYSDMWTGSQADGYGLQLLWTGTISGTLTLWFSDRPFPNLANDTDWTQDTSFAPTNPAGSAGNMRDDASNAKAFHKRIKYVNTSGTGVLFGYVTVPRTA